MQIVCINKFMLTIYKFMHVRCYSLFFLYLYDCTTVRVAYHKIANYFSFELLKKKIWANFQRIIELFNLNCQ